MQLMTKMAKSLLPLLVSVLLFTSTMGLSLPSSFKRCPTTLSDRNACLKVAVQEALQLLKQGLPKFNFPELEPIRIPNLTIGKGEGTVHVVQNFKNLELYGISTVKINEVNFTQIDGREQMIVDAFAKEIRLEADYYLDGKISVLEIKGNGKCTIKLFNTTVINTVFYEDYEKNGVLYKGINDFQVSITPEKVVFHFDNLFGGNKVLESNINKLLNDEWRSVFWDVRSEYEKALGVIFKNFTNIIHSKVSLNELYPP